METGIMDLGLYKATKLVTLLIITKWLFLASNSLPISSIYKHWRGGSTKQHLVCQ